MSLGYGGEQVFPGGISLLSQTGVCGERQHEGGDSAVAEAGDTRVRLPTSPGPLLMLTWPRLGPSHT